MAFNQSSCAYLIYFKCYVQVNILGYLPTCNVMRPNLTDLVFVKPRKGTSGNHSLNDQLTSKAAHILPDITMRASQQFWFIWCCFC